MPPQETLKHSKAGLDQSVWSLGPGEHKVLFELYEDLVGMGFDSKHDLAPPTILLRLHPSTALQNILLTMMATPFLLRGSYPQ